MAEDDQFEFADQIEREIARLEASANKTDDIRQTVVDKLRVAVEDMKIDANSDKPSAIEAKRGLVDTLLKALNDIDTQRINVLKVKQRKKADDESEDTLKTVQSTVAEFMRSLSVQVSQIPAELSEGCQAEIEAKFDEAVDLANIELLDGELEVNSSTAADIKR